MRWILIALMLCVTAANAETYISGQLGATKLSGSATEENNDARPYKWYDGGPDGQTPYKIVDTSGWARLAIGKRWDKWGIELGFSPQAGKYHRSADYGHLPSRDVVGEIVGKDYDSGHPTYAFDLRGYYYFPIKGRLTGYGYAGVGVISYSHLMWTGHEVTPEGYPKSKFDPDVGYEEVVKYWKTEDRVSVQLGGGVGLAYRLRKNLDLTFEVGHYFGPLESTNAGFGIRYVWDRP